MIPSSRRRFLFIRTDRLGETLLNLPAIAALKAAVPKAYVTVLAAEAVAPLLQVAPGVDQVLVMPSGAAASWWLSQAVQLAAALRARRFEVAIVSNPNKALHLAVWLAGIPTRVGYNRKWGGLLTHRLPDRKAAGGRHEVDYNLDLLRRLGVPVVDAPWQLPHFDAEWRQARPLLAQQGLDPSAPFIAIHPWTSNPAKQWPPQRYRSLLQRLAAEGRIGLAVIGGPEEQPHAASVIPPGAAVADLVGRLTLPQLAAVLQRARLLVSNDSGPVHLAAAVNTKTVVLFGIAHPAAGPVRWGPWGPGHTVIAKPSMEAIEVAEVVDAVRHQLQSVKS